MVLKLYAAQGSSKAKRILVAATYNGITVEGSPDAGGSEGKMPVLETDEGCIFSTNAIARYVARMRRDTGVYGTTFIESGAIDGWVEFCQHELEVPLCVWVYPKLGIFEEVPAATKQAKEDCAKAMGVLDKHLAANTFMVGHQVTLADITIACTLLDGFTHVMDAAYRAQFPNLVRWFDTCIAQPQFQKVLGPVTLFGDSKAAAAPKKEAPKKEEPKKKEEKKEAPKKEAPKKEEPKKKEEKKPAAAPAAPGATSPELEALKTKIVDRKAALKAEGKKGKEVNEDAQVVEMVKKLQELKAALESGAAPAPAAAAPAAAPAKDEKALKAIKKEGGKKGAEIAGAADMGGITFMNVSLELPEANLEHMQLALKEMNVPVDPTAEETKGGSGHVGKCLFSYGPSTVGFVCYVPKEHQKTTKADAWAKEITKAHGGKVVGAATAELTCGEVPGNPDKGLFPIKLKDAMLQTSITYLQKIGVFPDKDDSSDEMVFGDDDFPS